MKIESGTGNGKWVGVDKRNRIIVAAENFPYQHVISKEEGQAYQVSGVTNLANTGVVALHMQNTSTTRNMVLTFMRHQVVDAAGGTTFPSVESYFTIELEETYASGGVLTTAVNMLAGSGNGAEVTAYVGNPTLTGTGTEIDRWYTKAEADMYTYNKDGSFIIQPGQTVCFHYMTDHTSGVIYMRASFLMEDIE